MLVPIGHIEKDETGFIWVIDLGWQQQQHIYDLEVKIPIGENLDHLLDIVEIVMANMKL